MWWKCDSGNEMNLSFKRVPWSAVQLMMRAHKYGPQYGISAKSLDLALGVIDGWIDYSISRIVNNRLLIRVRAHYWIPRASTSQEEIARAVPWPGHGLRITCHHHGGDGGFKGPCLTAVTELSRSTSDEFTYESVVYRCQFCPSEYQVSLQQARHFGELAFSQILRHRYVLAVTRWMDVGECLSNNSREWVALSPRCTPEYFDFSCIQGIRSRFESSEGEGDIPSQ